MVQPFLGVGIQDIVSSLCGTTHPSFVGYNYSVIAVIWFCAAITEPGDGHFVSLDNPEKLATYGTPDKDTQHINKHNSICVRHHYRQANTNNVDIT